MVLVLLPSLLATEAGGRNRFAPVDVATWEHPSTISRLNGSLQKHNATWLVNHSTGCDLWIQEEHKLALFANEPGRL